MTEYCVCCGAEIPEGRIICINCASGFTQKKAGEEDDD